MKKTKKHPISFFDVKVNVTVDPKLNSAPTSEAAKSKLMRANELLSKLKELPDGTKLKRSSEG